MSDSSQNKIRTFKKTLDDLLSSKEVITGKEVMHNIKEKEKRQKEFENSMEEELRNRRMK